MRHPTTILTSALAVLSLAACAPGTDGEAEAAGAPEAEAVAAGPLEATSTGGTLMRLHLAAPLEPGPHRLRLELPAGIDPAALTADLMSPGMPMHGIVRVALVAEDAYAGAIVPLDIPMEGEWALYINVDESGADAAEFLFDVVPVSADSAGTTHNHDSE